MTKDIYLNKKYKAPTRFFYLDVGFQRKVSSNHVLSSFFFSFFFFLTANDQALMCNVILPEVEKDLERR